PGRRRTPVRAASPPMMPQPPPPTLFPYTTLFRSPEAAQGDLLLQGLVGRGDDAHVHLDRLRAADAEEGTVLEHTQQLHLRRRGQDRKSTRLNSSHVSISYAVFCLKKKKTTIAIDS